MRNIELEGIVRLNSDKHIVEYELDSQTGGMTLFLRVKDGKHSVPIYYRDIESVTRMLQIGRKAILSIEGDGKLLPDESGA